MQKTLGADDAGPIPAVLLQWNEQVEGGKICSESYCQEQNW